MKEKCVWKSKRVVFIYYLIYDKIPGYKIDGKLSLTAHKVCYICGQEGFMTDSFIKTKDGKAAMRFGKDHTSYADRWFKAINSDQ